MKRLVSIIFLANLLSAGLGFLRNLFLAKNLEPFDYGAMNLIMTIITFANFLDFGINTALIYEFPRRIRGITLEQRQDYIDQMFGATVIISATFSIASLIVSLALWWLEYERWYIAVLFAISIIICQIVNLYTSIARIMDIFIEIAKSTILTAFVGFIATLTVSPFLTPPKHTGIVLLWILTLSLQFVYLSRIIKPKWPKEVEWAVIFQFVRWGFYPSLLPLLGMGFQNLDRWVLAKNVSAIELGFYAFGATIGIASSMVPQSFSMVIVSKLTKKFGNGDEIRDSEHFFDSSLWTSSTLLAMAAGITILAFPEFCLRFMPKYLPGQLTIIVTICAYCLQFGNQIGSQFLLSVGKRRLLILTTAAGIFFHLVASFFGSLMFGSIGAGLSLAVSSLVIGCFLITSCYISMGISAQKALAKSLRFYCPLIGSILFAYSIKYLLL